MGTLAKAELQELSAAATPGPVGDPLPVQFNPTSLRLQMTNNVEGGSSRGRQVQQFNGTSSTVLSLDLVFDTADEGTTDAPRNVRERTSDVSRFVLPTGEETKQAPPRVRFHWGAFLFDGVMTSLNEDIDLFSSSGVPLRSKVSISIKEQDPRFEALESGPGKSRGSEASAPGQSAGAPGTAGGGARDRTGTALGGESAADFAARMGLDPSAWRGLAAGLESSLSLPAGLQIDFSANLSVAAGVGITAGFEVGAPASVEASVGLSGGGAGPRGPGGGDAGRKLAAAGGVTAAIAIAEKARTETAAAGARTAFQPGRDAPGQGPAAGAGTGPAGQRPPEARRAPLRRTGMPTPAAQAHAAAAPPPPSSDSRAATYGLGVPLRPRVEGAAADRRRALGGRVVVGTRPRGTAAPEQDTATAASWSALAAGNRPASSTGPAPCRCGGCR